MELSKVHVIDEEGNLVPATLLLCPACKGEEFVIYNVGEQDHPHFQCVKCARSYCQQKGSCHA
jgi:transposase-like protein